MSKSCTCNECKAMCARPCWPTPQEAQTLINNGYGNKLMLDYWVGDGYDGGDIYLLSPAEIGRESNTASFMPRGGCTLQDQAGLCQIHHMKPMEARLATCQGEDQDPQLHWKVAQTWNNPEAQALVEQWKNKYLY